MQQDVSDHSKNEVLVWLYDYVNEHQKEQSQKCMYLEWNWSNSYETVYQRN